MVPAISCSVHGRLSVEGPDPAPVVGRPMQLGVTMEVPATGRAFQRFGVVPRTAGG
jgi:hypothetical protein